MTAQIIDGKKIAQETRKELKQQTAQLVKQGVQPGLAVIIVGHDPASKVYVANKIKACAATGIYSEHIELDAEVDEQTLLNKIEQLNHDPRIHGILVQLPLPEHLSADKVIEAINPDKDVDGFHKQNVGDLVTGQPFFAPCTPSGVMVMLEKTGIDLEGKHAVVIGRSNIVGKPMAFLLLQQHATVTICTSRTQQLEKHTRDADILVAAVGRAGFVTGDMVKPGAAVIDVGINRNEDGKLTGDVDFASVSQVAGYLTPVPGGVGPMTITMLLANTIKSAQRGLEA